MNPYLDVIKPSFSDSQNKRIKIKKAYMIYNNSEKQCLIFVSGQGGELHQKLTFQQSLAFLINAQIQHYFMICWSPTIFCLHGSSKPFILRHTPFLCYYVLLQHPHTLQYTCAWIASDRMQHYLKIVLSLLVHMHLQHYTILFIPAASNSQYLHSRNISKLPLHYDIGFCTASIP